MLGQSEINDGRLGQWLAETFPIFFLWNRLTEINKTWKEARAQSLLPNVCVSVRSENQDDRPRL